VQQYYDGDRLRGKKIENGTATYYLRSSVLGGQVVAEMNGSGAFTRGYVYLGSELLAVQQSGQVNWVHQDPVAKSKRVTDSSGNVVSAVELDPWGGETNRSSNEAFQPHKFTTYERDVNGDDDAMNRRYNRWWSRFEQPDPYDGSYSPTHPQSFNRYSYVQNDPVNNTDPTGLLCPGGGRDPDPDPQSDYSGLLGLIFGRMEIDRAREMPIETPDGGIPIEVLQKPSTTQQLQIQLDYWKQFGKKLYDCLDSVFKQDAFAARHWLDSHGLPDVDFSKTAPELGLGGSSVRCARNSTSL
jgi:RHS repeat-associated protein